MTVSVVFAIAGVIALLFGIVGGGIKAKEIEVPLLPVRARIITIITGLILLSATIWLENRGSPLQAVPPTQPVVTSPASQSNPPLAAENPTETVALSVPTATAGEADLEDSYDRLYEAKTWRAVLTDSFEANDAGWTLWNVDDDIKTETMEVKDGVLRWGLQLKTADQFFYEIAPVFSYRDFYYAVKAKRNAGVPSENQAAWGILFRRQGNNYYTFRINDIQEYAIQIYGPDGWEDLIGWTKSPFIEKDTYNELAVLAQGTDFYFFLNGTPVGMVTDDTYAQGNVGFLAGLNFIRDETTYFDFDDFELRAP